MQLKPIHHQVVVLFGATSGIGLQTALQMAQSGASLALIGRDPRSVDQAVERAQQVAVNYHTDGDRDQVIGVKADAANWDEVKAAAEQVMAHFGRIDTWVQVASVSEWALFEDTSADEFRQVVDVNLNGMAYGAMAALPYLKQQDSGAIIFIGSVAGRTPLPYQSAYSASKHGVAALGNVLRLEMEHEGLPISVTTILPSSINTPLFNKARTKLGVEPQPVPPVYAPQLVADAIIYAAQHPVAELTVGGAGWLLQMVRRVSPALANAYMGTASFEQQRSDQTKAAIAPDNLFGHVDGYNQPEGDYMDAATRTSPQLWLATHPRARIALNVALAAGFGYAAYLLLARRSKPSAWKQVQREAKQQYKTALHSARHSVRDIHPDQLVSSVRDTVRDNVHPDQLVSSVRNTVRHSLRREQSFGEKLSGTLGDAVSSVRERLPLRRKSRLEQLVDVLSNLPLVGLLPFLKKPTVKQRIVRTVQHGIDQLPIKETQKKLKKAQKRLPKQAEKLVDKLQERIPQRAALEKGLKDIRLPEEGYIDVHAR